MYMEVHVYYNIIILTEGGVKGQSARPMLFVNGTPVEDRCSGVSSLVDADQLVGQPRREEGLHRVWVITQRAHGNAEGEGEGESKK